MADEKNILIVNDSKLEAIVLKDILKQLGFEVITSNEYIILKDMELVKPFMVIINYILKSATGDKIIEQIKKISPQTLCVLSSSSDLSKLEISSVEIDEIIQTPIQLEKLRQIFKKYRALETGHCIKCKKEVQEDFYLCPYCGERLKN